MTKLKSERIVNPYEKRCRVLPAIVAQYYDYWELLPPVYKFKASELKTRAAKIERELICLALKYEI